MNLTSTQNLVQFYDNIDIFLLVLVRFLGFFIIVPIFSGTNVPAITKIGFAFFIAVIIVSSGKITEVTYYDSVAGFIFLFLQEFLVGFTIGFVVYTVFAAVFISGQMIDQQIGFSMVSVMDPTTQLQVPIVGNLFYFIVMVFMIQTGGLNAFIHAVFDSYDILPIATASFSGNEVLWRSILALILDYYLIGVRISLPLVGSILIIDVAMGLLVKAAPQMNIFTVGMPIKLLIGLVILYLTLPTFGYVYEMLFLEGFRAVMNVIEGMMP